MIFRHVPLEIRDALTMMQEIKGHKILDAIRGMEAVNKKMSADMLITIGNIGLEIEAIEEIDLNPVIISTTKPFVVDVLIVLSSTS